MLKSELELGKTYTHNTGGKYSSSELVIVESLEPQMPRHRRTFSKPSPNLVLVSVQDKWRGEERTIKKTVLVKNLFPEQDYHEEKEHARQLAEARKQRELQGQELGELLYTRGQEIAERLGVERHKLQRQAINTISITHTYTLAQIKELLDGQGN